MLNDIYSKRQRLRDFSADSVRVFLLIWQSGKRLTIVNSVLFVLQAAVPLLSLLVLKNLIDLLLKGGVKWEQALPQVIGFGLLQLLQAGIVQISAYQLAVQQQVIADSIAGRVLNKAVELDFSFYDNPAFYDELHLAQQQSLHRPAQIIGAYQGIIQNFTTLVLFSGFMLLVHWSVLVLIIVLSIPLAVSKMMHGYQQFQFDKKSMPVQRKANGLFSYLTTDIYAKEVRVFNFGQSFISQFLHLRQHIFSKRKELHYKFLKQNIIIQCFEIAITTIIYCIIIAGAVAGTISMGGLVIYFQVFQRLQGAIAGLFQSVINLFQNQLYLSQITEYLAVPAIQKAVVATHLPVGASLSKGVVVSALSFTYPGTDRQVLKDINMEFLPGRITAIVGENGSGKSTLIKILCGLYNVAPHTVLIGGTDVTAIDKDTMAANVTAVFQDFGKYYLTVEDNLTLGGDKKDRDIMDAAAEKAGILEKIKSYKAVYKTQLGRTFARGEQLSGGQWQKIALARMFYKSAPIVILDEPTSSLDPVAENTIFSNLKQDIDGKTIILITHRLYNLKLADYIYVMSDGMLAEEGAFDELLARGGVFAGIYNKQAI